MNTLLQVEDQIAQLRETLLARRLSPGGRFRRECAARLYAARCAALAEIHREAVPEEPVAE